MCKISYSMIPVHEIPKDFILRNLTDFNKKTLEIKYYIENKLKETTLTKTQTYENLAEELNMSYWTVHKIANNLK